MSNSRLSLDQPYLIPMNERESALTGWFFAPDLPGAKLSLEVGSSSIPVFLGLRRPDVADYIGAAAAQSGFAVRFKNPASSFRVRFLLEANGQRSSVRELEHFPGKSQREQTGRLENYLQWIVRYEPEIFWPQHAVRDMVRALPYRPRVSIVLVHRTSHPDLLWRTFESISQQFYTNYELVITGTPNQIQSLREITTVGKGVSAVEQNDTIFVEMGETANNLGTACTKAAQACTGEYTVFIQPEDELHPHALVEMVRAINEAPDASLFYSDEDRIPTHGVRCHPLFKPGIDRELLLSCNYIGNSVCVRTQALRDLGELPPAPANLALWDLALRLHEQLGDRGFKHITKPLYHRRVQGEVGPPLYDSQDISLDQAASVLEGHLARTGAQACVEEGVVRNTFRLRFGRNGVRAAVVVRLLDGDFQLHQLAPLAAATGTNVYQAVGNVLHQVGTGHGRHLTSLSELTEDVFIFINRPIETLNHDFLNELVSQASRPECGVVSGIALTPDRKIDQWGCLRNQDRFVEVFAGRNFPCSSYMGLLDLPHRASAIKDYFFACRRELIAGAGGLGSFDASCVDHFLRNILRYSASRGLGISITPYAIATFALNPNLPAFPAHIGNPALEAQMNPRIAEYADPQNVFAGYP